jgi:hypothetical protein
MKPASLALAAFVAATGLAPAASSAQVSVVGSTVQESEGRSGSDYTGTIEVRNDGASPASIQLYMADYLFRANGTSAFPEAGKLSRSNAGWITLGTRDITIPPGQTVSVPYLVKVPSLQADSISGSYWSVAMVEAKPAGDGHTRNTRGVNVQTIVRHAVQIVTHVGSGSAVVRFSNVRMEPATEGRTFQFDTENTGTRARRLTLSVDLYASDGKLVGRFTKARGLVLPGCSIRQIFNVGALEAGDYEAFIVADAGGDDLFAGRFKVTL